MTAGRAKRAETSRAVFTEFYDTDDTARAFAKAKLESGTAALTPESLEYMRRVIAARKEAQARAEAAEKAAKEAEAANE